MKNTKLRTIGPYQYFPVSKVFERIIHDQLHDYFNSVKLFYKSQYGFRHMHSTELAVLEMMELVIEEMDKNEIPINIYHDLSKAFDKLDHAVLLYKLQYHGLKQTALKLLTII